MKLPRHIIRVLFLVTICSAIGGFAKPSPSSKFKQDLTNLYHSILRLKRTSHLTYETMFGVRRNRYGLPDRNHAMCSIPTYLLYNEYTYRFYDSSKHTIHENLDKIKNTLWPISRAALKLSFGSEKNTNLRKGLKKLANAVHETIWPLYRLMKGKIKPLDFNSHQLTEHVKLYLTCLGSKITSDRVEFLRHVTFVEAVEIAVVDLFPDLYFIEDYLNLKVAQSMN